MMKGGMKLNIFLLNEQLSILVCHQAGPVLL